MSCSGTHWCGTGMRSMVLLGRFLRLQCCYQDGRLLFADHEDMDCCSKAWRFGLKTKGCSKAEAIQRPKDIVVSEDIFFRWQAIVKGEFVGAKV
ncbi:hypothetical protein L1887_06942 [Cichorium endivia]|nr:hypothetical protein L1887_06942 [Cichorium endivia]